MAQTISGEIACSEWCRVQTCQICDSGIWRVRITGFVSHFVYKGTTQWKLEKPQKCNELDTKSCTSWTMNYLKESFTIMKAITEQQHWKRRFYVTLYVCKVCCLKKPYEKPLINLDRLVITGKYQTSVFYI